MSAIQACGVGQVDLYKPISWLAVPVAVGLAWLSFSGVPHAAARTQEIRADALRQARFGSLEPGRFFVRSFGNGSIVFYAERVDDNGVLYNVFAERTEDGREQIWTAARAEQRGIGNADQLFILYEGEHYEGIPGQGDYKVVRFSENGIPIRLGDPASGAKKREAETTAKLFASSRPEDQAELQMRVSVPLMGLVLTVIAVPLARLRPRQGRYGRMGIAILVCFFYANWLEVARVWMEKETLPAGLGLWWVHAIMLALGLLVLVRESPPFVGVARLAPAKS
jgi:lipopolysaccharide export system permease protein